MTEAINSTPDRFDENTQKMGKILCNALDLVAGLFEQSRSIEQLRDQVPSEISVLSVLSPAIDLVRPKIRARNITLDVEGKLEGTKLRVNHLALVRVLSNLLQNAIDAVEDKVGHVTLSMGLGETWVEFAVHDNGPGIAPQYMEKIFEAHFTTKQKGTGMGLYICKHLVESMNGMLTLHNKPGHGCCFSVKIPR